MFGAIREAEITSSGKPNRRSVLVAIASFFLAYFLNGIHQFSFHSVPLAEALRASFIDACGVLAISFSISYATWRFGLKRRPSPDYCSTWPPHAYSAGAWLCPHTLIIVEVSKITTTLVAALGIEPSQYPNLGIRGL